jgi:hypothetical protein
MKRFGLTSWLGIGIVAGAAWLVFGASAGAHQVVAQGTTPDAATTSDVGTLLAPMVAAATGIERILEMAWSWFENAGRQLVATIGLGASWANYAQLQVHNAEATLTALTQQARPGAAAIDLTLDQRIAEAERNLINAQQRVSNALDSDRYRRAKQAASIIVGVGLGIAITIITGLDMFKLLGLTTSANIFGEIVTGVIIGAGTGPVHSLIGLLQQTRDAVDEAANFFNARALENKTRAIATASGAAGGATTMGTGTERDLGGTRGAPLVITAADADALARLARR